MGDSPFNGVDPVYHLKSDILRMDLPPNWELRECKNYPGRVYYYNPTTNESTWIRPVPFPGSSTTEWPPMVYCSHILIRHSKSAHDWQLYNISKEEAKTKINKIYEELIEGKKFDQVAKEQSNCESASNGGDLGWIKRGVMPPEFEKVAWSLTIGQISSPVETVEGFHIIFRQG